MNIIGTHLHITCYHLGRTYEETKALTGIDTHTHEAQAKP